MSDMRGRPVFARLANISSIYGYRGGVHHPRALALLSLISKLGRHRPAHIVIRPSRYRVMPLVLSSVIVSSRPRRLIATVPIPVMIGGKQRGTTGRETHETPLRDGIDKTRNETITGNRIRR